MNGLESSVNQFWKARTTLLYAGVVIGGVWRGAVSVDSFIEVQSSLQLEAEAYSRRGVSYWMNEWCPVY